MTLLTLVVPSFPPPQHSHLDQSSVCFLDISILRRWRKLHFHENRLLHPKFANKGEYIMSSLKEWVLIRPDAEGRTPLEFQFAYLPRILFGIDIHVLSVRVFLFTICFTGEGRLGKTYLAWRKTGRILAVKLLPVPDLNVMEAVDLKNYFLLPQQCSTLLHYYGLVPLSLSLSLSLSFSHLYLS